LVLKFQIILDVIYTHPVPRPCVQLTVTVQQKQSVPYGCVHLCFHISNVTVVHVTLLLLL